MDVLLIVPLDGDEVIPLLLKRLMGDMWVVGMRKPKEFSE